MSTENTPLELVVEDIVMILKGKDKLSYAYAELARNGFKEVADLAVEAAQGSYSEIPLPWDSFHEYFERWMSKDAWLAETFNCWEVEEWKCIEEALEVQFLYYEND